MKGNLSKKKGFLRDLENNDLSSISDILEVKYGKELVEVKNSITALDGIKENVDNRIDEISETTNERRGKYASAEAVYDYGQKIKNEANKYTDSLESKHNKRFNTVETNLGTIQTELTKQLSEIEAKVEKEIQDLESKHDKSIKTVEEDITALEEKKENVANRTDKISETTNERRGKYASAEAVYRYGSEIKNKANEYTDVMFDDVVVQFEEADKVIRSDVANVRTLANDAYNIAKGANRAIAFENYQKFCEYILAEGMAFKENYPIGTTILIAKSGVPDLWYYGESNEFVDDIPDDNDIVSSLSNAGHFDMGYYRFAQAETQNVDLTNYYTKEEITNMDLADKGWVDENKEDVINKILGGNYPITHPDCTIAKDEYYVSLKYLKECFDYFKDQINASGGGGNVDLSNYFTKDEMIEMIEVINNELNEREFTSNRVTVIDEMSMMQGPTYPTARAVFDFVNEKIGDIETSLENIITKYGLGGDAS